MPNEPFENYLSLVTNWESAYSHSTVSYCAIKGAGGVHLLFGRIRLELSPSPYLDHPFYEETKQLIAARFGRPLAKHELREIFEKAKSGKLQGTNGTLSLPPDASGFSFYWADKERPLPSTLNIRGIAVHSPPFAIYRDVELTWELNSAPTPCESLNELLNLVGLPNLKLGNENARLEIEAASPGEIDHASIISEGNANIVLRVSTALDLTTVRLGFQYSNGENRVAGSFSGPEISWNEEGNLRIGRRSIPVGKAPLMRAYLSCQGIPLDRRVVNDPKHQLNSRRAIHLAADPDMQSLEQSLLSPAKRNSDEFENAVAVLLTLLGFSTIHYGLMRDFKDGPDAVAVAVSGHVAVVECTTGYLDIKDKLTKLIGRASKIKTCLREAGHETCEVLSVIVSALPRDEVKANIKTAEEMRIAVVCKEQLESLSEMVMELPDSNRTFEYLKKLIPFNPNDVLGEFLRG